MLESRATGCARRVRSAGSAKARTKLAAGAGYAAGVGRRRAVLCFLACWADDDAVRSTWVAALS